MSMPWHRMARDEVVTFPSPPTPTICHILVVQLKSECSDSTTKKVNIIYPGKACC